MKHAANPMWQEDDLASRAGKTGSLTARDSIMPQRELASSSQEQLDRSLVRGVAWTGGMKWVIQIVTWASTLVVAHILTPNDYGVVSIATVYLGVLILVSDFGVGAGVVAFRETSKEELAQMNTVAVLLGVLGFLISCLIALPAGRFFHSPQLPRVLIIMSTSLVISSFQSVPSSLLRKEFRFKLLSVIDGCKSILLAGLAVALAFAGFRYWTLVIGAVASSAIGTLLVLSRRRHRYAWPRWSRLRNQIRFSRNITIGNLAWHAFCNADFVVAGRMLNQAALGSYTVAYNLANTPLDKITAMVSGVTPAYYSAVQDNPEALRRYLIKPTEFLSLLTFPVMIGLALVAPEAIPVLLGAKWAAAIVPLQLLALLGSYRSLMPVIPQVLVVTGETSFLMWNSLCAAVVLPLAFVVGSRWGINGIAAAWIIAYPVYAVPLYVRASLAIGLRLREYLSAVRPAFNGCLGMAFAVFSVKAMFRSNLPLSYTLAAEILTGALAYCSIQFLFHRERVLLFRRVALMMKTTSA